MKTTKIILAAFIVASLLMVGVPSAIYAGDTIKIGEIQTYSKLTNFTFPYRNGWQLALEEINSAGGVMGKQIEVISRDDAGKPGTAVTVAEELVRKDKVDLLMGTFFLPRRAGCDGFCQTQQGFIRSCRAAFGRRCVG